MSKEEKSLWSYYSVTLRFRDKVAGGVPAASSVLDHWINDRLNDKKDRQEVLDSMGADLPDILEERSSNTFMKRDGMCCLRDYQIKALLKESANILGLTKAVRGLKNAITNGVFIRPAWIPLGFGEPTSTVEIAGHVITAQGPRSIISKYDIVDNAEIKFSLKICNRVMLENNKMVIEEEQLRQIFEHGQESGLGAARARGFGTFDVVEFRKVSEKEAEEINGYWSKVPAVQ